MKRGSGSDAGKTSPRGTWNTTRTAAEQFTVGRATIKGTRSQGGQFQPPYRQWANLRHSQSNAVKQRTMPARCARLNCFFFFKQKTAYEISVAKPITAVRPNASSPNRDPRSSR